MRRRRLCSSIQTRCRFFRTENNRPRFCTAKSERGFRRRPSAEKAFGGLVRFHPEPSNRSLLSARLPPNRIHSSTSPHRVRMDITVTGRWLDCQSPNVLNSPPFNARPEFQGLGKRSELTPIHHVDLPIRITAGIAASVL